VKQPWQERIDAALCEVIEATVRGEPDAAQLAAQNAILVQIARGLAQRLDLAEQQLAAIDEVLDHADAALESN
jgi:hypothetical protein